MTDLKVKEKELIWCEKIFIEAAENKTVNGEKKR